VDESADAGWLDGAVVNADADGVASPSVSTTSSKGMPSRSAMSLSVSSAAVGSVASAR
jgi:hypothetical protein